MENDADTQLITKHATLEERDISIQHARATVRGRYASGGVDLAGAADGLLRVSFGRRIDEAHGSGFPKEPRRFAVVSQHHAGRLPQIRRFKNIALRSKLFKSP